MALSTSACTKITWPGRSQLASLIAAGMLLGLSSTAKAGDNDNGAIVTNQQLLQKLDAMEQRIKSLEAKLKEKEASPAPPKSSTEITSNLKPQNKPNKIQDPAVAVSDAAAAPPSLPEQSANGNQPNKSATPSPTPTTPSDEGILGLTASPVPGLSIGAYGEVQFGWMQNPAAGGQWQLGSDAARRLVLLPTYAITDNIIFNAEIEFEHAGAGFDNDDKLHGTAEIEQLWVDFKIADPFNWRAPGIDLVPIGYINQHHEPTEFYSVLRPELYNGLIPSTWKVPATSIYGTIADGVRYQLMLSAAQEDFGDAFDCRTAANTVPPGSGTLPCTQGGASYFPGIDGLNALTFSNPPLGDFRQLSNSLAVSGRLDFMEPASIPGLAWSISAYYTPNTTPRGAHGDLGNLLGRF